MILCWCGVSRWNSCETKTYERHVCAVCVWKCIAEVLREIVIPEHCVQIGEYYDYMYYDVLDASYIMHYYRHTCAHRIWSFFEFPSLVVRELPSIRTCHCGIVVVKWFFGFGSLVHLTLVGKAPAKSFTRRCFRFDNLSFLICRFRNNYYATAMHSTCYGILIPKILWALFKCLGHMDVGAMKSRYF